ncbi:MAG: carboxypeptidase-like regulatory domain-containing protein, partial [Mucilaginibacter sp.]
MNTSKLFLLFMLTFLVSQLAMAQHIFKGTVVDSATLQPLYCACIHVGGKMCCCNKEGYFQISLPNDTATLSITYIGFTTKVLAVKHSNGPISIRMNRGLIDLREVVIAPSLGGGAFHTLSTLDLSLRPVNSSQDLMRLVPGLFIAQHMGGGKAEQIFIRGFDADHGTDLNISADGMPVNMVSHIHGQGYADLHFLIPETVKDFDFGKGPY